jgi:hypothetical protein
LVWLGLRGGRIAWLGAVVQKRIYDKAKLQ